MNTFMGDEQHFVKPFGLFIEEEYLQSVDSGGNRNAAVGGKKKTVTRVVEENFNLIFTTLAECRKGLHILNLQLALLSVLNRDRMITKALVRRLT